MGVGGRGVVLVSWSGGVEEESAGGGRRGDVGTC